MPLRVQLVAGVKLPLLSLLKLTLPVGVTVVPESLSVTVAVQLVALPTEIEVGLHATEVVVVRLLTVKPFVSVPVALPPPLPGFVTVTLRGPVAAAVVIVMFAVIEVLLLNVVVFTVIPEPKLTVDWLTKFVPVNVTFSVVFRSPLLGEALVTVGAVAAVAYVAVKLPLLTLLPAVASTQIGLVVVGVESAVLLPTAATFSLVSGVVQLHF